MNIWDSLVMQPLGWVLHVIFNFTHDYGLTIILFTVLIRGVLFPLAFKQQKSMQELQKIQPLIQKLQEKYKNDKEKLSQETVKLYQEHKVNPLGSCLPTMLQIPIFLALYYIIMSPVTYIMQKPDLWEKSKHLLVNGHPITQIAVAQQNGMNFSLFGWDYINLAQIPSMNQPSILWIFPLLSALTTFASSKMMSATTQTNANDQSAQMMKSMNTFFPFMTAFICFSVPAGVGFYWVVSNLLMIVQQYFLSKHFKKPSKEVKS